MERWFDVDRAGWSSLALRVGSRLEGLWLGIKLLNAYGVGVHLVMAQGVEEMQDIRQAMDWTICPMPPPSLSKSKATN